MPSLHFGPQICVLQFLDHHSAMLILPRTSEPPFLSLLHAAPFPSVSVNVEQCGRAYLAHVKDTEDNNEGGAKQKVDEASLDAKVNLRDDLTSETAKHLNYYELLGLGEYGYSADAELIKHAYRKAVLLYHPDKSQLKRDKAVFLTIQDAYNTLSSGQKRRAYDSSLPFDDTIPSAEDIENDAEFYTEFGQAFARNARFAVHKPVPSLGDDNTAMPTVQSFYSYWVRFESWRDFSLQADVHDLDTASCREEKRWMMKENDKLIKNLKKDEYRRLNGLVETAMKLDPRLRRAREAEKEAKRQEELRKAEELRLEQEERERRAEEERIRLEQEEQERKQAKIAREKSRKQLHKARSAFRRAFSGFVDAHGPSELSEDDVELLCAECDADLLGAYTSLLSNENHDAASVEECRQAVANKTVELRQQIDAAQAVARPTVEIKRIASDQAPKKEHNWTPDELSMLAKAVVKYPAGTGNRWVGIANYINMQLALVDPVTKDDCIAQYQRLQAKPGAITPSKVAAPVSSVTPTAATAASTPTSVRTPTAAGPESSTSAESKDQSDNWTQEQQRQLEEGLKKFPASMDKNERWKAIAEGVPGKSRKDCVERYKALRAAVQAKKATQK